MTPEPPNTANGGLREVAGPAYDVCNPDRLPAERVVFVDGIHRQFLEAFGQAAGAYLDTPVAAAPGGVEQMAIASFLDTSATDACLIALDLAPMPGQGWVGMSPGFLFRALDILLGAPPAATPAGRTTITEIERHVLREFFQVLLTALGAAWAPGGIRLHAASIGPPQELRHAPDADGAALVLHCEVKFSEAEEHFRVAIPVLAIRLAALQQEQHAAGQATAEAPTRAALLQAVSSATVQVEAVLGGSTIRLGDLAAIETGQILMIDQPATSQLDCLVNGKAKYRGDWISHDDRHGLQIESLVQPAGR
jgi:flagellar motor switch protein FliM